MYPWHFTLYSIFLSEVIISFSFHLYIIQTNFFRIRILLFTSNYVVSLNITLLHFQISSATNTISIFNFILDFNFHLRTSNLNFNFTHHLQTSTLNFSLTSYITVTLNLQTTISICIFILQLQILTSFPAKARLVLTQP